MNIHSDLSGKEWIPAEVLGREEGGYIYGVPRRIYINFEKWSVTIGARTQWWDPWHGATRFWSPIAIWPSSEYMCYRSQLVQNHCGRLVGHKGKCADGRKLWQSI